jgi:hypothetical protein
MILIHVSYQVEEIGWITSGGFFVIPVSLKNAYPDSPGDTPDEVFAPNF